MADQHKEEKDIDFSDTRSFASQIYNLAVVTVKQNLSVADRNKVSEPQSWQTVQSTIQNITADTQTPPITKRLLIQIIHFPRSLETLVAKFIDAIHPFEADVNIIWGLVGLNIKLSYGSPDKLSKTVGWMKRLRYVLERFNGCLGVCEDMNEPRYAMVEILDFLLQIQGESVRYLRGASTDEANHGGRVLDGRINDYLAQMDSVIKHLNDINSYSKANLERQTKTLTFRSQVSAPRENVAFPIRMLPRNKNNNFYGRKVELQNIAEFLGHEAKNLRTYTIYGRRGVGKTDLALEYAHTNPSGFEAIFWINCETSVGLRQSFTDMAIALNIPGADRSGRHEENHLAVFDWLKTTERRWLLVYDNAEEESILQGYWPINVKGSILITSRNYFNFSNDAHRNGRTIKPFTEKQSWDLLMKLLGPEWVDQDRNGLIKGTEERAAIELLKNLGGLALAIEQAAELIKNDAIGGPSIASTYDAFKEHQKSVSARQTDHNVDSHRALESLWHMRFTNLSRNSLILLSVLSLLSPDGIIMDLFLPRDQKVLNGRLSFCKQGSRDIDAHSQATLSSVINPPPLLRSAIDELVSLKLIKLEGRELWVHRVVQEAMRFHSAPDLPDYFQSAAALVHVAFPKQLHGDYLSGQWGQCETYIPHGVALARRFASINRTNSASSDRSKVQGLSTFLDLLSNCAWYLYEIGDYDMCLSLVETGRNACDDKRSLQYANLCNIAGGAYYEMNRLVDCRLNWETFLNIQEDELLEGDLELSIPYHNMGNLEWADSTAHDHLEKAMEYFERAVALRIKGGDAAASLLANSYLCMSRVYFSRKEYTLARNKLLESQALFRRTAGADANFMAHVHYAFGNVEFDQKRWLQAKRSYDACLKIVLMNSPMHPLTCATYYSLGAVEYEQGNMDLAKKYLTKAMAIAQLRNPSSPGRIDGTTTRIMWKISEVLEFDTFGRDRDEAEALRIEAEMALARLTGAGGGGSVWSLDEEGLPEKSEMELAYDSIVPGFFR